jgi:benzoyl-CoA reductase/2-hydroxyglutaryl-CoA dehydratase subunit BcrC/BadD/HgdB
MVNTLESIAQHRRSRPGLESDARYYELMALYYGRVLSAREEGKLVVGHTTQVPTELMYALDMVPLFLEGAAVTMAVTSKSYEETFGQAKGMGFAPEICSVHRCIIASFSTGWAPRPDALVWCSQTCDNNVKTVDPMMQALGIPGFFLDAPYYVGEKDIEYFSGELEEMVTFLEGTSGRKMDWGRLEQSLRRAQQMVELHREIYELRGTTPSPVTNRKPQHIVSIMRNFLGTQEGVDYMTLTRNEIKATVEQGDGDGRQEHYRLLSIYAPPSHNWKILDWMERERGAMMVGEPHSARWGEVEWDFSQPLLTLARRVLACPTGRQNAGPLASGLQQAVLEDAVSQKADGAIYWAGSGCRQGCAAIRSVKDALRDETDLPTMVVDMDTCDPTFVSDDETKDKLEGFFDLLDSRK